MASAHIVTAIYSPKPERPLNIAMDYDWMGLFTGFHFWISPNTLVNQGCEEQAVDSLSASPQMRTL